MVESYKPQITARDRKQLAAAFEVEGPDVQPEASLDVIREAVVKETDPKFASMGAAIRSDLTSQLDADIIESALVDIEAVLEDGETIRKAGVPERYGVGDDGIEELYRELIAPVWEAYEHLVDVGLFESLEENLPAFTREHIDHTARGLLTADSVIDGLADCDFNDSERTALLMNVVNNETRLSHWVPTCDIPDGVEFNVEYVPPLYHRAIGGGLLWVKALDRHLVQKEILLTEQILDDAYWRAKATLGGVYVFLRAAQELAADEGTLTDGQLVAALSAGAAITIVNQEELMQEVFWIHEEKRAPSLAR